MHKYNAKPVEIDGIRFDSKKEGRYYSQMKLQVKAKEVKYFLRQVPFDLPGNTKYRIDFQVFYTNGKVRYLDVKGFKTQMFILKKKQVEAIYPIEIEVV